MPLIGRSTGLQRLVRALFPLAAAATVALIVNFAVVFACTANATIGGVNPSVGPAGARVTVSGQSFAQGPVEVRWGTDAGPLLARTTGPDFAVGITVPNATPGWYYVVVTSFYNGSIAGRRSAVYQVTAPVPTAAPSSSPVASQAPTAAPAAVPVTAGAPAPPSQPGSKPSTPTRATHQVAAPAQPGRDPSGFPSVPGAASGANSGPAAMGVGASSPPSAAAAPSTVSVGQPVPPGAVSGDLWPGLVPGRPGSSLSDAAGASNTEAQMPVAVLGLVAGGLTLLVLLMTLALGRARALRRHSRHPQASE